MKTTPMTPPLYDYVLRHCDVPHPILHKVAAQTASMPGSQMLISQDQGMLLHTLVKILGAKLVLEIGCFTGYSAIAMASALPAAGKLISLDINPETSALARDFFAEAGLADKIDLRVGDAMVAIGQVQAEFGVDKFDMVFVDADKANLWNYFERSLELLRPGGIVLVDNVVWDGKILDAADQSNSTKAIRAFNERVRADARVEHLFLHISDGIYILRKK